MTKAFDLSQIETEVDLKAPLASPAFTGTVSGVTKAMVGLTSVDNTSDANKPVSVATQSALDGKVDDGQVLTDVPAGALFTDTDTVYTHPTHPGDDISVDTGPLTGADVVSDIDFNVTTDVSGHVTAAAGVVATRTLTLADLGYFDDSTLHGGETMAYVKSGRRNKLINGNFDVWQRGQQFGNPYNIYTADRWNAIGSDATIEIENGAGGPGQYALAIRPTSAANYLLLTQALELHTARSLAGRRVTLSVMYSSESAQPADSLAISVAKSSTPNSLIQPGWIVLPNVTGSAVHTPTTSIQKASITVDIPADGSADGVRVALQTTNTVNAAHIYLYGMQLEVGSVATDFEERLIGEELSLCYRYYQDHSVGGHYVVGIGLSPGDRAMSTVTFTTIMRETPTVTILSPQNKVAGKVARYNNSATDVGSGFAAHIVTPLGFRGIGSGNSLTDQAWYGYTYIADAEL